MNATRGGRRASCVFMDEGAKKKFADIKEEVKRRNPGTGTIDH